jgi:hypothetical protein
MARWITLLKAPFNFHWPRQSAVTCIRETGEFFVKDELADAAVKSGYAIEGKASEPKKATTPRRRATTRKNASNARQPDRVGPAGVLPHGRPDDSAPLDHAG